MRRWLFLWAAAWFGLLAVGCDSDGETDPPLYAGELPGELVEVAAGPFTMGGYREEIGDWNQSVADEGFTNELPRRVVTLSTYFIQRTEVTNAQYRLCVLEGPCTEPEWIDSRLRDGYFTAPEYSAFPAVGVTWIDAAVYCEWAGMRLPTEAEWEKAARGPDDARTFPWGNEDATCDRANLGINMTADDGGWVSGCVGDTMPVGSYPYGASPYGLHDLAGNASEWVADRYAAGYYDTALYPDNLFDPQGPGAGERRVIRGGSYTSVPFFARTGYRGRALPETAASDVGFRCARN